VLNVRLPTAWRNAYKSQMAAASHRVYTRLFSNDGREPDVTNVLTLKQPGASVDHGLERNPGMPFTPALFSGLRINRSAVERRAATISKRRSIKKDHQTAWLLKAVTCIDLTTLSGDDTVGNVRRLCRKARQPVRKDILEGLGVTDLGIHTGAVLAGIIGSKERSSYALVGDTVNLASRIQGLTKEFSCEMILSQTTHDLITGSYKMEELPAMQVKGKSREVMIYKLLG